MNKRTPRRTADQWARIITDFKQSGLSVNAYCEQHSFVPITFHKWKRRLSIPKANTKSKTQSVFVPVKMAEPSSPKQTQSSITLQIGSSITLTIEHNGDTHEP